jgi:signal peptidase I
MPEETQSKPVIVPKKKNSFREEVWETVRFLLISFAVVIPLRIFVAQPFIVSGASMDPTFYNGQYLIVDELSYNIGNPDRGDVVVFKYPKNPSQYFIKRIIGLPGETVSIDASGYVSIKDKDGAVKLKLTEPYVAYPKDDVSLRTLGDGEYFVMGDNRAGSFDSRAWGPVPRNLIVGKAFLRLFPLNSLSVLPGQFRQP